MVSGLSTAVGWSAAACVLFGVQNYVIGFTNSLPDDDFARTVGLLWLATGVCGLALLSRRPSLGIFFTDADESRFSPSLSQGLLFEDEAPSLTWTTKAVTVAGGLAIGGAQLFMKASFAQDPIAQGPLSSVVCADVILVSVVCHFAYDERLSLIQWLAVALVFGGLIVMAGLFDDSAAVSALGFGYALLAMVCFGLSVLSVRVAAVGGLSASSGFIARTICMGCAGLVMLLFADWQWSAIESIALPLFCGMLQAAGVYTINAALAVGPYTSISIAIFGSNSLVVLLLAAAVDGHIPPPSALAGMALTAAGCISVSLAASDAPDTDSNTEGSALTGQGAGYSSPSSAATQGTARQKKSSRELASSPVMRPAALYIQ